MQCVIRCVARKQIAPTQILQDAIKITWYYLVILVPLLDCESKTTEQIADHYQHALYIKQPHGAQVLMTLEEKSYAGSTPSLPSFDPGRKAFYRMAHKTITTNISHVSSIFVCCSSFSLHNIM